MEALFPSFLDGPISARTTWTLARNGHRIICTLTGNASGTYVLRLTCNGRCILDERCDGPRHALTRSLDALGALLARGWVDAAANN